MCSPIAHRTCATFSVFFLSKIQRQTLQPRNKQICLLHSLRLLNSSLTSVTIIVGGLRMAFHQPVFIAVFIPITAALTLNFLCNNVRYVHFVMWSGSICSKQFPSNLCIHLDRCLLESPFIRITDIYLFYAIIHYLYLLAFGAKHKLTWIDHL